MASELSVVLDGGVPMAPPPPDDDDNGSKSASKKPGGGAKAKAASRARSTKQNVKSLSTGFGSWNGTPEPRISIQSLFVWNWN